MPEKLDKSFDDPEVRRMMGVISLEKLWSKEAWETFGPPHDTHYDVAVWLNQQAYPSVLDVGCGMGGVGATFAGRWIGVDISFDQLREASGHRVLGNALSLPFADAVFPAVTALYMLYFFDQPKDVAREAWRVLEPGGAFVVCAPSRHDAPEFAHVLPDEDSTFYSEDSHAVLDGLFENVVVNEWNFPMFDIPDRQTVCDYLYSWYYPRLTPDEAWERSGRVDVPLKLTKRGSWAIGYKR
jgi:SAM-dependent methyltransferase